MSSVLARHRKISEMEFYRQSYTLRCELTSTLMSEKVVPKRWRPIFTFPTLDIAREMMDHIIVANNIYPATEEMVAYRKAEQQKAIDSLDQIEDMLQYMIDTLFYGRVDADHPLPATLITCGNQIDVVHPLLVGWKKGTKLIAPKQ